MKCLVVGAGMSGLTAARLLQSAGWKVTVLDKGRGVGGRMATRRLGDSRLDHGAQFFTVRHPLFANAVQDWRTRGLVEPWFTHDQHVRYRAAHGMNTLAKELAADLDVRTSQTVTRLHSRQGWAVETESGAIYEADLLLMTAPAPQLIPLLKDLNPSFAESLRGIAFDPCLALLVTGDGRSLVPAPGFARPADGPVAWVADNRQKGLPGDAVALTLHATPEFSREYLERPAEAEPLLRQAAAAWLDGQPRDVQFHRWRYSIPTRTLPHRFLSTTQPAPLIVAGDAFGGPRVEGAFLSGWAAAEEAL